MEIVDLVARNRRELSARKGLQEQITSSMYKQVYNTTFSQNNVPNNSYIFVYFVSQNQQTPLADMNINHSGTNAILFPQMLRQQATGALGWAILVQYPTAVSGNITLNIQVIANVKGSIEVVYGE